MFLTSAGLFQLCRKRFRPALGSPLINAGNGLGALPAAMLPVAQPGGLARKQDGALDIGAYEY